MAGFTLAGKVVRVSPVKQVTDSFKKRDLVIEDRSNEQYPEYVVFQFVQDKVSLLDNYRAGDMVTVHFNLKGRAVQKGMDTEYFSNIQGWKVDGQGSGSGKPAASAPAPAAYNPNDPSTYSQPDDDSLPF